MTNRLAMSILVRDEADIIAENIRFHADQGVDFFIVMDNDSKDGTRDILRDLQNEFDIQVIDQLSKTIDQDLWVTQMVEHVRDAKLADWIILNDADEFWIAADGRIKDEISNSLSDAINLPGVIRCSRFNMLPAGEEANRADHRFFQNVWKVSNPFGQWPRRTAEPLDDVPHLLQRVGPKAMCAVDGFRSVGHGNHVVDHDNEHKIDSGNIEILHYPIRSYNQFERKVRNYGESLMANDRLRLKVAHHFRQWYELLKKERLKEEFAKIALTPEKLDALSRARVIENDPRLYQYFRGSKP